MAKAQLNGWTLSVQKRPISNAIELAAIQEKLLLPNLPEMLFGGNVLSVCHSDSGFSYSFNAVDALDMVGKDRLPDLEVASATHWKEMNQHHDIKTVVKPFDWTYWTAYSGSIIPHYGFGFEPDPVEIDWEKLKIPEPILFYDSLVLYESELDDNGVSILDVKIRAMPSGFLILCRFFLRVDGVCFKINETRMYHSFDSKRITRNIVRRQIDYAKIKDQLPLGPHGIVDMTFLSKSDWVSSKMGPETIIFQSNDSIKLNDTIISR